MLKKYLPYILLIAAALLLFFIKKNQRGEKIQDTKTEQTDNKITVPAVLPGENAEEVEGFNRKTSNLIFSKHAKCRMQCRNIDESEIREILKTGIINHKKIQSDKRGMTYPVEGFTHDRQHVRIVFAPKADALVVVTVIDLDTEWKCDCK